MRPPRSVASRLRDRSIADEPDTRVIARPSRGRSHSRLFTGPPSNTSIEITPSPTVTCTQTQSCNTIISTPPSATNPTQTGGDPDFRVVVPSGRLVWPSNFPNGKVGTAYAAHLQSSGGKAPFHWTVHAGKLAPGLTLNASSGAITGKPTTKGKFVCIVVVTDSESPPKNAPLSVPITIT
jgi:hypothetical protein